jgi:hypothetical protein
MTTQMSMTDIGSVKRDLNTLVSLTPLVRFRLALNLPLFYAESEEEVAWMAMTPEQQAGILLQGLTDYDKARGNEITIPQQGLPPQPQQLQQLQPPLQQTNLTPIPIAGPTPGVLPLMPVEMPPISGKFAVGQGIPTMSNAPAMGMQPTRLPAGPQSHGAAPVRNMAVPPPPPAIPPAAGQNLPTRQPSTPADPTNLGAQASQLAGIYSGLNALLGFMAGMNRSQNAILQLVLELAENALSVPKAGLVKLAEKGIDNDDIKKLFEATEEKK